VKAEVDFIRASFAASGGGSPDIVVHRHCGECGAIGAALEAQRVRQVTGTTAFVGLDAARRIRWRSTRNEATRCRWCTNACLRTFIDVDAGDKTPVRRVVIASCEKGEVEALADMREVKAGIDARMAANPNLLAVAAREAWMPTRPSIVSDPPSRRHSWSRWARERAALVAGRPTLRVGIPRVLHLYNTAPLFSAYLESLGISPEHLVYSDVTSGELYRAGCSRGSIDPCFPSKVSLAHVHNLLWVKHARTPLDVIFFPMFDVLRPALVNTQGCNGCPTATMTPQTVHAAQTKERDVFADQHVAYLCPMVDLSDRRLFAQQMLEAWSPVLGLTRGENDRAVAAGFQALDAWEAGLRRRARTVLDALVRERRLGIVILGRGYHHDDGINQGIPEALQKRGYPILSQNTLPRDTDLLDELFGDEVRAGVITSPLDISDVWKHTSSESTNVKLWAAKFAARHPNLVAIELSSFKCGHDAPTYTVMDEIFAAAGTPFFAFRDLDENKAAGSIALRVETIDYFLRRYRQALSASHEVRDAIASEAARHDWSVHAAAPVSP
jgi:predicted nucleotide-binding protein (sugar kinase/HSP70/actin superfamily)